MGVPDPKRGGVDYPEIGKVLQVRTGATYTVPHDCILLAAAGVEYNYSLSQGYVFLKRNNVVKFERGHYDTNVHQFIVDAKYGDVLSGSVHDNCTVSQWVFLGPPDAVIKDSKGVVLTHAVESTGLPNTDQDIGKTTCYVYSASGKLLGTVAYTFYTSVPA